MSRFLSKLIHYLSSKCFATWWLTETGIWIVNDHDVMLVLIVTTRLSIRRRMVDYFYHYVLVAFVFKFFQLFQRHWLCFRMVGLLRIVVRVRSWRYFASFYWLFAITHNVCFRRMVVKVWSLLLTKISFTC